MQKRAFGELELAILRILRKKNEATVQEVANSLGQSMAYTTVLTVMKRLFDKKLLARKKIGRSYSYSYQGPMLSHVKRFTSHLKENLFHRR